MYVCVCNAVTEKQVKQAIDNGAVTVPLLKKELNVATQCGACCDCLEACLAQTSPLGTPAGPRLVAA
ncbi:MAG: (2Fe-2S)-binding protein [Gammaproteobacteria bacterium]